LLQLKSNPDKKRRKLQEILFKLEDGIGNVTELYKFIDPIQILNTSKYKREIKHTIGLDEKILEPENDSAITLSYDDFKKSEEYEIKVNGHYYTDKALLSNIFKILNELIEGITGHNHVEEGDEEESVDPETTQGEVRNDKVVSDSTEELKYSEIERLEKVTLNFFTKYVNKLQKNIEVGKKIDSTIVNPLLFSVSAIFNSLLINNVLNLTSNSTLKPISILKMEDYVEIGTSMIGGIYNFKSRKSFISKDVYEKDTFIQNGLKYSFLSTAFILSSIRSLNSKILLQLDNSYKMLFYNAVDISRRNNYIPTRNDFEEYLSKLLNNSKNSHIFDEKKVMDNFEILFASYDKIFITKEPLKIKDINNFNIYFSELFGFVMPINLIRSNEKVDFAYYLPGIYGECESKRLHYGTNIGRAAGWKEIKYKSLKSSQL
jgi:hypothetical protein